MKLLGRNLKLNMTGDDVALLQGEMSQLGFHILPQEIEKKRFGKSTRDAVRDFQKRQGLAETGQVDEKAATGINRELEQQRELLGTNSNLKVSEEIAKLLESANFERRKAPQLKLSNAVLGGGTEGEKVRQLHATLGEFGSSILPDEALNRHFGETTEAAVKEFQRDRGLEPTGTVDAETAALLNAAVAFRIEGNTPKMRQALRSAVKSNPASAQLAYWLARYEILAGNYEAAHEAAARAPEFSGIREVIGPMLSLGARQAPHLAHPANYYTYRHELVDNDIIRGRKADIREGLQNVPTSEHLKLADLALDCLFYWNQGNSNLLRGRYIAAESNYELFYENFFRYFIRAYTKMPARVKDNVTDLNSKLILLRLLFSSQQGIFLPELGPPLPDPHMFQNHFAGRTEQNLTLDELFEHDWVKPKFFSLKGFGSLYNDSLLLGATFLDLSARQQRFDAPLLILACVFVPLALAETKRLRRQFDPALQKLSEVLQYHNVINADGERLLNGFIEIPYVKIQRGQVLLEKADSQYKAGLLSSATETYRTIVFNLFEDEGHYGARVHAGANALNNKIADVLARPFLPLYGLGGEAEVPADASSQRHEFQILGKEMSVPTIESASVTLPGLDRNAAPLGGMITFVPPNNETIMKETNPFIYAIVSEAKARLMQIEAEFNYLGYRDDYVPPWRFQFLLDRARYFADHARNAQREYLNFLSNAEREEFQETTLTQSVELEKSNVRIETARVEQTKLEIEATKLSMELAELVKTNANRRYEKFKNFDDHADHMALVALGGGAIGGAMSGAATGAAIGAAGGPIGALGGAIIGGLIGLASSGAEQSVANEQREFEKFSLSASILEANKSAEVAKKQFVAAQAGLVVSGILRCAALLRHEHAVQNLAFLRGRVLSAEAWHRLAGQIRAVGEAYMRYAIELGFLAEQAYEFEADKRINVIRFDYDVSEERSLLAADFLLRDLDTIEQDLIVTQKQNQQQVRYILSLNREFPEAMQELRDFGSTIFSLRLEPLERRFPGLFNLRIALVEVTPVALMDPTRFSLELTNLGIGQVRLQAQPDTQPGEDSPSVLNTSDFNDEDENVSDPWISEPGIAIEWPVKIRVTGPETFVFSGLSEQDRAAAFPFASTSRRNAFEGLAGAATWRIDMSMKENQVVPYSLVDVLIAFTLSGYHDPYLRRIVDNARRRKTVPTKWLSAERTFPDFLYEFTQTGRMEWEVPESLLSLNTPAGTLRNLAVVLVPPARRFHFGALMANHEIEFRVTDSGDLEILSELPEKIHFKMERLKLAVMARASDGADVFWAFGDDGKFQKQENAALGHTFSRPGRHVIRLRIIKESRLFEFKGNLSVSKEHQLLTPLAAVPLLSVKSVEGSGDALRVTVSGTIEADDGDSTTAVWKLTADREIKRGSTAEFPNLKPGTYTLSFTALRTLKARIYSRQRHLPESDTIALNGLSISTNRTFNETTGKETTQTPNELTTRLFPQGGAISPVDNWTFELPLDKNPFLRSVTQSDIEEIDLREIADVILSLEYESHS